MIYEFIIMVIGCLFPAFASYNSLTETPDENVDWIKYWIVFGFFNAMSFLTASLESWLPFLIGIKLIIVCWMQPSFGAGYQLIYDMMLDPLLRHNKTMIQGALNTASSMSSLFLRELVKMIYSLLADLVEYCWQMNLNADDFHVTPRLQMAVNDVITELRAARQAVKLSSNSNCNVAVSSSAPMVSSPIRKPTRNRGTQMINVHNNDYDDAMPPMPSTNNNEMIIDDEELRIQLANAASAKRMQFVQQYISVEHLVPTSSRCLKLSSEHEMKNQSDFDLDVNEMPSVDDLSDGYF